MSVSNQASGPPSQPNDSAGSDNVQVYRLHAGPTDLQHHIMRVQSNKYDINSLQPPVRLVRDVPKPRERRAPAPLEDGQPPREKMDTAKVAPWGGAIKSRQNLFKKKTKAFFHARQPDEEVEGNEEMTHAERKKLRDPDRYKWLLSDFQGDGQGAHAPYYGEVESSQNGHYFLFVESENGFKVVPVTRHYKFAQKPAFNTLTPEQMEELMKEAEKRSARQNTWVMKKLGLTEPQDGQRDGEGGASGWSRGVNRAAGGSGGRRQKEKAEDIDYEDEFADDEEVMLGFDDEGAQREAERRMLKADDDDSEEEEEKPKPDKKIKKVLRTTQQSDSDDDEEENPYISDQEESEEDAEKEEDETDKEKEKEVPDSLTPKSKDKKNKGRPPVPDKKGKAKGGSSTPSQTSSPARVGGSSPAVKRERGMSPANVAVRAVTGARSPARSSGAHSPVGRGGAHSPLLPTARSPVKHAYSPAHPSPLGAGAARHSPSGAGVARPIPSGAGAPSTGVRITLRVPEETANASHTGSSEGASKRKAEPPADDGTNKSARQAAGAGNSSPVAQSKPSGGAGKRKADSPADGASNKKARQTAGAGNAGSPANQSRGARPVQSGISEDLTNKQIKVEPGSAGSSASPRGVKRGQSGDPEDPRNKKVKLEPGPSGSSPSPATGAFPSGKASSPPAKGSAQSPPVKRLTVAMAPAGGSTGGTPAARLLTEQDIIDVLHRNNGTMKVRDLVAELKAFLGSGEHSEANKANMRVLTKRLANHDKSAGIITLKPEFMPK